MVVRGGGRIAGLLLISLHTLLIWISGLLLLLLRISLLWLRWIARMLLIPILSRLCIPRLLRITLLRILSRRRAVAGRVLRRISAGLIRIALLVVTLLIARRRVAVIA